MRVARKFILTLIIGVLLVHGASAFIRVQREQEHFEMEMTRDSRVLAYALGQAVERAWDTLGGRAALDLVHHATREESHLQIRWVWVEGDVAEPYEPVAPASMLAPLRVGQQVITRFGEGDVALYTYTPLRAPSGRLGAIEIANPMADEHAYLRRSVLGAALTALVLVLLCGFVAWLLGLSLIGWPVEQLVRQARAIGEGDFSPRSAVTSKDELGELSREMNDMAGRLDRVHGQLAAEMKDRIATIEQLRHADRLTSVGTLASGVAHELGTPLNVVEGHAELIQESPNASPDSKENARIIGLQCHRMTAIIRQLLDFARQGGDGATGTVGLVAAAREASRLLEPMMRKRGIEPELDAPAQDPVVKISRHHLQQVIMNIAINAIHSMPDGGCLTLAIGRRAPPSGTDRPRRDLGTLTISDTGSGMSPETAERVFEPFFTTKDVGEGTGLGLSVAYGIIEEHGGWIDVDSRREHGSTFTIVLPVEAS